jgi:hypothetical protein
VARSRDVLHVRGRLPGPRIIATSHHHDMTVERWRIESVYDQAAARPEPDRAAFLREACAGDEALRREVETLLAAHEGASSFLETPTAMFHDTGSANETPEPLREHIGRYRVTDRLGEGGMGVVYAAVDEQLDRPIALKIIRRDTAADPVARERFWREARLSARVNHPHICQVYEIGESDGQLFIAMERLEGESLAARLGPLTEILVDEEAQTFIEMHETNARVCIIEPAEPPGPRS